VLLLFAGTVDSGFDFNREKRGHDGKDDGFW